MSYIAPSHPLEDKVYELKEQWDGTNGIGIRRKLNALIKESPDLIEAYNFRYDILGHEDHIVAQDKEAKRAYKALVTHYFSDGIPETMEWGHFENRPLLRSLNNYAVCCWVPREKEEAIKTFKLLLKLNPSYNQGARFCLLGIMEGMSQHHFFHKMDQSKLLPWFQENCHKYPELVGFGEL